jgi:hypothetical protein
MEIRTYRVSWEFQEPWDTQTWHPATADSNNPWSQYNQLCDWAETGEQPVRNVRLERLVAQPIWEPEHAPNLGTI